MSTVVQLCVSCSLGVLCLLEGVMSVSCCHIVVTLVSASNRVLCACVSLCDLEWCVSDFVSGSDSLQEVVVLNVLYAVSMMGVVWWVSSLCSTFRESV